MAATPPAISISYKGKEKSAAQSSSSQDTASIPRTISSCSSYSSTRSGGCAKFPRVEDHPNPLAGASIPSSGSTAPHFPPPELFCGCEEPTCTITSSTVKNPGRNFLKCRKMNQVVNCNCYKFHKVTLLYVFSDWLLNCCCELQPVEFDICYN